MFAPTTHLQQADQQARARRRRDVLLIALGGTCAIAAGLAMNAISTIGVFIGFLPV
ncbi:MAG TPA: hypothetical protein VHT04_02365 [Stellaceae bacterium]|nr:hypothetical protein [Stellaceae bacterium]